MKKNYNMYDFTYYNPNEYYSKTNKIKKLNGDFLTDKKDKFLHGIGLKNIKLALEKYNGEIIIEPLDDKFILKMLIPINQEKEA